MPTYSNPIVDGHDTRTCWHRYEQELHDTAAFDKWRADVLASDRAAHADEVRLRIIEMAEAQDAAIQARQAKIQEHLELGHCIKVRLLTDSSLESAQCWP